MDSIIKMLDKSLDYISHELINDTLYINIVSNEKTLKCPICGTKTTKVHSKYLKTFQDLPIQGKKVILRLNNKNMFCVNSNCEKYTFSEKFEFLNSKAKKTTRLTNEIIRISLTQSSVSAARYLTENIVTIKKSSICNYLKKK